jgi:hypothetical protein
MAGAGFLALAHTSSATRHIRVTLLLGALRGRRRPGRWTMLALGAPCCWRCSPPGYTAWLGWQSPPLPRQLHLQRRHAAVDPELIAWPLGDAVLFVIAFIDELVLELRGKPALRDACTPSAQAPR